MKRILKFALIAALTITLAGCCGGNKSCGDQSKSAIMGETRGSEDFNIGVAGFTYRKFSIDETLAFLKDMGVHYLSIKDFWLPIGSSVEEMEAFKAKCASFEVEPYILGPIYMRSQEAVDAAFDYVARFGHAMFIGVPNYELLDYTASKVRETGIKVAIHTHGPDNHPFPNIKDIVDRVKDPAVGIGCCMDLGHSVRYGDDILKDIAEYKDWIYDIHMKDESEASRQGNTWEMGRGVMNYKEIVAALRQIGYTGKISLEFEKNAENPTPGVAESIGYFRGVCDATK